jgi:hypothetical protein
MWLGGAAMSLMGYFWSAIPIVRRTPVGVERRLFGLEDTGTDLLESPSGGRWMLVVTEAYALQPVSGASYPTPWERLESLRWPNGDRSPRTLSISMFPGTWEVNGSAVRWVWRWTAKGWLDDHHLWAGDDWPPPTWVLDLRNGRSAPGKSAEIQAARRHIEQAPEPSDDDNPNSPDRLLESTLTSALEELPADLSGDWDHLRVTSRGAIIYLVYTKGSAGQPLTLYAVSDDPAPRILRLAHRSRPLALSRNGRVLFFSRDGVLWRLDLRKPLSALLAELPVPELADESYDRSSAAASPSASSSVSRRPSTER